MYVFEKESLFCSAYLDVENAPPVFIAPSGPSGPPVLKRVWLCLLCLTPRDPRTVAMRAFAVPDPVLLCLSCRTWDPALSLFCCTGTVLCLSCRDPVSLGARRAGLRYRAVTYIWWKTVKFTFKNPWNADTWYVYACVLVFVCLYGCVC